MKILELFSGYGTASFALKQLGIPYECVGYSDIDKYANQCFAQNHSGKELGDATKINPNDLEDFDLLTGGFPCQAFSIAGKGLGELDTRGTLFNEIIRIAEVKKPRYMLLENVKGLTNKNHRGTFIKIMNELHRIDYFVKTRILNTKEHGIPQNRQRVFFACFKNKDEWEKFEFPEKEELKIFLKDILEEQVDEKYYLSEKMIKNIMTPATEKWQSGKMEIDLDVARPLTATMHKMHRADTDNYVSIKRTKNSPVDGKIHPCIDANYFKGQSNQRRMLAEPRIIQRPHGDNKGGEKAKDGICPALTSNAQWEHNNYLLNDFRIRKLTPKECFRLQGFLNDEVNLEGLSNTQKYKLAGNGQSVNVVKKIFERMFL